MSSYIKPPKKAMHDLKAMELQTAKEILAEVFMVRISEVDEMIQNRFEKFPTQETCGEDAGLWPQEFWLDE